MTVIILSTVALVTPVMKIVLEPTLLPNIIMRVNGDVIATASITYHLVKVIWYTFLHASNPSTFFAKLAADQLKPLEGHAS
jgi:hypothetical protein